MKYNLVIREHEDYGENGIVILDGKRDYFDPALRGSQIAHDLLEHPVRAHNCGYTDELMAIGGVLWMRLDTGYSTNPYRNVSELDVASDIVSLANYYEGSKFVETNSGAKHLCHENWAMETIESALDKVRGDYYAEHSQSICWSRSNVRSWIVEGYQRAAKRYRDLDSYNMSHGLFKEISKITDKWLKHGELEDRAVLHVTLSKYKATLTETYEDYYDY